MPTERKSTEKAQDTENHTIIPDCFVIMPISDVDGYRPGHFKRVFNCIFEPACEQAGFKAVRADQVRKTDVIHVDILQKLLESPMAICDLSTRNPNVLFELGLRQAFDKPVALVREVGTHDIFDIGPLRYSEYRNELLYDEVLEDQENIANQIKGTYEACQKGEGINSIVKLLSLTKPASLPEVSEVDKDPMLQLIRAELHDLRSEFKAALSIRQKFETDTLNPNDEFQKEQRSISSVRFRKALASLGLNQYLIRHYNIPEEKLILVMVNTKSFEDFINAVSLYTKSAEDREDILTLKDSKLAYEAYISEIKHININNSIER